MGVKGHETRDIFPDFKTYVFPPVSPAWFRPKSWGIAEQWSPTRTLNDPDATFITDGVEVGDVCFLISPLPQGTFLTDVWSETFVSTFHAPPDVVPNPLYKLGHGIHHTIQTLAAIVGARAVDFYTLHHGKLWTDVRMPEWATDQTGEVYVISHDTRKARWLDGEIDLPVGFPGPPPGLPPAPLPIAQWEDRFPDTPRPHYPPGLEPGGDIRAALLAEFGTLLAAHDHYSGVHP